MKRFEILRNLCVIGLLAAILPEIFASGQKDIVDDLVDGSTKSRGVSFSDPGDAELGLEFSSQHHAYVVVHANNPATRQAIRQAGYTLNRKTL